MIIHYLVGSENDKTSVGLKCIGQKDGFIANDISCELVFFGFESSVNGSIELEVPSSNFLKQYRQKLLIYQAIEQYIEKEYNHIDYFYIRFLGSCKALNRITKRFGQKILFEVQSNGVQELPTLSSYKPYHKLGSWISYFQFTLLPRFNEFLFRNRIFKNARDVVFVSNEIANEYSGSNKLIMANGITRSSITNFVERDNSKQHWLFLKGSTMEVDYLGLDRLIKSFDEVLDCKLNIQLHLVGNFTENELISYKRAYTSFYEYMNPAELKALMQKCHLGIGSLSLHRINMYEASVLKVRQYFANGLLVLLGYHDTDISKNRDFNDFVFEVPNNKTLLPIDEINKWVAKQEKIDRCLIIDICNKHLSWDGKIKKLLSQIN